LFINLETNKMNFDFTSDLISACNAGNEPAIERLICEYQTGIFRLALSILDDPAEASEATQDAFISILRAMKSYEEKSSFKAWIYTITLNLCRNRLRKRKSLEKLKTTLSTIFRIQSQKTPSPEDAIIQNENDAALWGALNGLGEKHRTPIVLRYFHDLSPLEIAEILDINEGTVHSRLHYGREQLRIALENISDLSEKRP
jgi:RNA polymerase sigma-70 factor (ECF subfamily)